MNNNAWFKKEMPLQTVIGFGGGATGFGAHSSAATKTYMEDVFSTYLYPGNSSNRSITTGIDLAGKGGMVWTKDRANTNWSHFIADTARGVNKRLVSNSTSVEDTQLRTVTAFNSDGHSLGVDDTTYHVNNSSGNYSSWTFRKQKGFFDVVTYTGTGSNRTIAHSLGSMPGMIIIKNLDSAEDWRVYHRSLGGTENLLLNTTDAAAGSTSVFNQTDPTASVFTVGTSDATNKNGDNFVAYVFAGGKGSSDNAVEFDGSTDALSVADFPNFRTSDFTVECWFYTHTVSGGIDTILDTYPDSGSFTGGWWALHQNGDGFYWGRNNANPISTSGNLTANTWYHVAMVRNGTSNVLYLNGKSIGSFTETAYDYTDGGSETRVLNVGRQNNSGQVRYFDGLISNVRITKGQALYTTSFNVPHDPLTQTSQNAQSSNVKLICCNGNTTTASTVTPGTITEVSSPSVSTSESIFDDTSAYIFGDNEDKGIIKTGKYIGNGSSTGPEIFLGWEPQWLLIRGAGGGNWNIVDCMRGISAGNNDNRLWADLDGGESASIDVVDVTSTGFKIKHDGGSFNGAAGDMLYMAIRRPDGYVGKLPSAGTDVFAMDTWVSDSTPSTEPNMISNFIVDLVIDTDPTHSGGGWQADRYIRTRQIQSQYLKPNDTDAEATGTWGYFDYQDGWMDRQGLSGGYSDWTSFMWKRGQGVDVVCYTGDASWGRQIKHSLNQVPEMMWLKQRNNSGEEWIVYHKDLDGGTAPETHYIFLHSSAAEADADWAWSDTAPTSTHFTVGGGNAVNGANDDQVAYLFASANDADGNPISKVGSYSGSSSAVTVTTGFQPRFVLIKRASGVGQWSIFDTHRGWAAGDDKLLELSDTQDQETIDGGAPTSTGFTVNSGISAINNNGDTYLYYAHA